jgi:hypothetical protein
MGPTGQVRLGLLFQIGGRRQAQPDLLMRHGGHIRSPLTVAMASSEQPGRHGCSLTQWARERSLNVRHSLAYVTTLLHEKGQGADPPSQAVDGGYSA